MEQPLDLISETLSHFNEGARSVKAYTDDKTYIITKASDSNDFWITLEEPGFPKTKISSLDQHFQDVFGIEGALLVHGKLASMIKVRVLNKKTRIKNLVKSTVDR